MLKEKELYGGEEGTKRAQRLLRWAFNSVVATNNFYSDSDLSRIFDKGYWVALFGFKEEEEKVVPPPGVILEVLDYLLPRFLNKNHYDLLKGGLFIHFTDNPGNFFTGGNTQVFRPTKRGRVYRWDKDENGQNHITYLVRTSLPDNPTDVYEVLSFLSLLGYIKQQLRDKEYFNSFVSKSGNESFWEKFRNSSITFSKGLWEVAPIIDPRKKPSPREEIPPVFIHMRDRIKKEMTTQGLRQPKGVLIGNNFSVPLVIASGFLDNSEVDYIFSLHSEENNSPLFQLSEKAERIFNNEDKALLRRYAALMFLNRYQGDDWRLNLIKTRVETGINCFRKKILPANATVLGDAVDVLDFREIPDSILTKFPHRKIKEILETLRNKGFSILLFSYPLGDSIYGMIKALYDLYPEAKYGFFGKVGAVIDEQKNIERGRVVLPEWVMTVERPEIKPFSNQILPEDCVIIPQADRVETLFSNNSLFLQSYDDIRRLMGNSRSIPLLDMEGYWLKEICDELGIVPYCVYYVSDQTPLTKNVPGLNLTRPMTTSEGVLATLVSGWTILYKWAKEEI